MYTTREASRTQKSKKEQSRTGVAVYNRSGVDTYTARLASRTGKNKKRTE
jgi:hypothetical protein